MGTLLNLYNTLEHDCCCCSVLRFVTGCAIITGVMIFDII